MGILEKACENEIHKYKSSTKSQVQMPCFTLVHGWRHNEHNMTGLSNDFIIHLNGPNTFKSVGVTYTQKYLARHISLYINVNI